jgi:molybdopterin molybdotransferase
MLNEDEARARILEAIGAGVREWVPLSAALGRFAMEPVAAEIAVPGFDNSAMDGYALRVGDGLPVGARLRLKEGEQPAGKNRGFHIEAGEALRIFTGAPMPTGADAVVMQEDVTLFPDREIRLEVEVVSGEFVRRGGSDVCAGQILLRPGDRLTAARCGILASQGRESVAVGPIPSVTVVTTGDELLPPGGARPGPGELYNSNGPMLAAMVREVCGPGAEVEHCHARDDESALAAVLGAAIEARRVVIVSGGVSVGDHDLVKPVLAGLGVTGDFWRVRVKPGKPFYFGLHSEGSRIFGLPGNPVSSFVTFLLFVAPALRVMMGASRSEYAPPGIACRVDANAALVNPGDRPHYVRGQLDFGRGSFRPTGIQQSHALFGLSQSNALLRIGAGETLEPGAPGTAILY